MPMSEVHLPANRADNGADCSTATRLVRASPADLNSQSVDKDSKLSYFDCFALLVSFQVGSGIFSSPSQVNNHVPYPGAALLVWVISGFIVWMAAASFAELGTAIPTNGGMQQYLRYVYGDFLAFLMSWIWIFGVRPSSAAILFIKFAEHWTKAVIPNTSNERAVNVLLSFGALAFVVLFNCMSFTSTSRFTIFFLFLKLATIGLLLLCCSLVLIFKLHRDGDKINQDWKSRNWFTYRPISDNNIGLDWDSFNDWELLGQYTTALYAGLWAYSGWDSANMVAGEIKNPSQNLPKAIHTAVPTVTICFILANLTYYFVIPWQQIGTTNAVAVLVGQKAFGTFGGPLFAILISMACLGSANNNVFTTGRITVAAAKLGYFPHFFADIGLKRRSDSRECLPLLTQSNGSTHYDTQLWMTPIKAILFNAGMSCIYIMLGSFGALVTFIGIAEYCFFFLTVVGLLILRVTQPSLRRPYRPAIWMPIIFSVMSLLIVIRGVIAAPIQSALLGSLLFAGGLYHLTRSFWMASPRQG